MGKLTHQLIDADNEKILNLTLDGKILISETGKAGKLKTTEKEFPTSEDAQINFYKKEWEMLKKGFVLKNIEAKIGQPKLHYFIGTGYTGCLSLVNIGDVTAIYKFGDFNNDMLVLIDETAKLTESIKLPKPLPWQIEYHKEQQFLLINLSHFIYTFSIKTKTFTQLTFDLGQPGSFISLSEKRILYATHPTIYVKNIETDSIIFERKYESELYSGHSTQYAGAISKDGNLIALCTHSGKIILVNLNNGEETVMTGNFEMVKRMEFINDDQILVLREQYGTWGMHYFDMSTLKEIEFPTLKISNSNSYLSNLVDDYCFNNDYSQLVLIQGKTGYLFDFKARKLLHSFKIEHVIKRCNVTFLGDKLGVRTDYGCFSIYNI